MIKRILITALVVAGLPFSLAGCVQPSATPLPPSHGDDGIRCGPQQRGVVLTASLRRRIDQFDPGRRTYVEDAHIAVIVQAGSPAPGYQGIQVGTGITGLNPLVISGLTTYSATLCWDLEYPVALLVRVGASTNILLGDDEFECVLEDAADPTGDFVDHQMRRVNTAVDFAPGADESLFVQCQDIYVPGGGSMAGVRPQLLKGMVDR